MKRAKQINKAVEEIFNNADIALEDRAMLRMWYSMGAKFADDNPKNETNWQQVRIQAAIAAMQGLCNSCHDNCIREIMERMGERRSLAISHLSIVLADALVKELKGE
jgi:hypothetical protein